MLKSKNKQGKTIILFLGALILFIAFSITNETSVQAAQKYVAKSAGNNSIYVKDVKTGCYILFLENTKDIVYKGNKIYYIKNYQCEENQTPKLCQYDVKTKKHKTLVKFTGIYDQYDICDLYSGSIYINCWVGSDCIYCYRYIIKDKKLKKIDKFAGYVQRYKNRIVLDPTCVYGSPGFFPIYIYDTLTGKIKTLTKTANGGYFTKKTIYYANALTKRDTDYFKKGGVKTSIKKYSLETGKIKTLVKSIKLNQVEIITDKYVCYNIFKNNGNKYYIYNIKTRKKKSYNRDKYYKIVDKFYKKR